MNDLKQSSSIFYEVCCEKNEPSCCLKCHESHPQKQKVLGIFEVKMSLRDGYEMGIK